MTARLQHFDRQLKTSLLILRNSVLKNKITQETTAVGLLYNDTLLWTDEKVELNGKRQKMLCIGSVYCLMVWTAGPCRGIWRGRWSKYKRGTWNRAFNRAVLLADMCIEMDASWYSSKCHDAGLKKKHRTEKTVLSLNIKEMFCTS